jgi:hypothetical protein
LPAGRLSPKAEDSKPEGTGAVKPGAAQHAAYLSGTFIGGVKVLALLQLKLAAPDAAAPAGAPAAGVLLKVGFRCEDPDISRLLLDTIS